jgi:hypothetical protein
MSSSFSESRDPSGLKKVKISFSKRKMFQFFDRQKKNNVNNESKRSQEDKEIRGKEANKFVDYI